MAKSCFDRSRKRRFGHAVPAAALLLSLALSAITTAVPAELSGELDMEGINFEYSIHDGSLSWQTAVITHQSSRMRIEASFARRVRRPGDVNELTLSGGVHIDYRGALLDAESAVIVFRGAQLQSGTVQGKQATFSHQPAGFPRRVTGRADSIEFDGAASRISLSGDTWYTDGRQECSMEQLLYDLDNGSIRDSGNSGKRGRCILRLDDRERVPPPRTPERSTAQ